MSDFLYKILKKLGLISPRLTDEIIYKIINKIDNIFKYDDDFNMIINYFIDIKIKYVDEWNKLQEFKKSETYKSIDKYENFIIFKTLLQSINILNKDELIFLDDAIHEYLIE